MLFSILWGCSSYELSAPQAGSDSGYYRNYDESTQDMDDAEAGAMEPEDSNDDGFGSETEAGAPMLLPATTNAYVFVANPDRNTVTRIEVGTLEVMTVEVGVNPTLVETTADYRRAVTFNQGSNSLSVVDASTLSVEEIAIRSNLNQMALSPDGNWVLCYHDITVADGSSSSSGAISFNAISIVNLAESTHFEAMAGMSPHDVHFSEDSSLAVLISDDYLTVLDLSGATPEIRRIAIAEDLIHPPKAEEVLLDPAGQFALIRQYGMDQLVLVNLNTDTLSMLDVGANPTDMDVSPDGSQAMVVARVAKEIWMYDLQDPTLAPLVLALPEDEVFGSLVMTDDEETGLLYSSASGQSRVGVWNRNTDEVVVRGTVKPISGVDISPSNETIILFHPQLNGDTPSSSLYYNHFALSLLNLEDLFTSSYLLDAEVSNFASSADGRFGLYTMSNQPYLEVVNYQTFVPMEQELPSIPIHLGSLPDSNAIFISQQHDLGRISFYDTDSQQMQTITGFELNALVE